MRVDYSNWGNMFQECPVILLDGEPLLHVSEADDVAGYAIVVVYGEDGRPVLDESGENIAIHRVTGRVKIVGKLQPWVQ